MQCTDVQAHSPGKTPRDGVRRHPTQILSSSAVCAGTQPSSMVCAGTFWLWFSSGVFAGTTLKHNSVTVVKYDMSGHSAHIWPSAVVRTGAQLRYGSQTWCAQCTVQLWLSDMVRTVHSSVVALGYGAHTVRLRSHCPENRHGMQ